MKVSELISKLQKLQTEVGDKDVGLYIEEIDDWTKHYTPNINDIANEKGEIIISHLEWSKVLNKKS